MASIINAPNPAQAVTLGTVSVTASPSTDEDITNDSGVENKLHEFLPRRTLKNSVASTAPYGNTLNNFEALASDIPDAFGTNEQPKLKFLFTVQFYPRAGLKLPETGDQDMSRMKFALKRATRPQPSITYQDVNFYGFRNKVAIKMDYGTVTLTFYDDVVNRAHNIVSQYLNYVSPISLINKEQADSLDGSTNGAISIGAYADNPLGPFSSMRIVHHMVDNLNADTGFAKQVFYDYLNPKIISVNLDDLDMSQSDVSTVEVTFVYDSVNIIYSDVDQSNPTTTDTSSNGISSPTIVSPIPAQGSSTTIVNAEGWTPIGPGSNGTSGGFFGNEL